VAERALPMVLAACIPKKDEIEQIKNQKPPETT